MKTIIEKIWDSHVVENDVSQQRLKTIKTKC